MLWRAERRHPGNQPSFSARPRQLFLSPPRRRSPAMSARVAVAAATGARKGLAAAGTAAVAVAAAGSGGTAESRAAPPQDVLEVNTESWCHELQEPALSKERLKEAADAMVQSGEFISVSSSDGTQWLDVAKELLEMGTEMASREDMQQIIMETAERKRNHALTLRLLEAQQVDRRPPLPLSESGPAQIELVSSAGGESTAELVASPADEVVSFTGSTPSINDVLAAENEALRLENVALRQENVALGGRAHAAAVTLQKAARTRLTRTLWYKRSSVVRALRKSSLAPTAPNAQVRVYLQVAGPGAVRVSLKMHASSDGKQADGKQAKKKASSPRPETSYEALLVAISIVVGVLAVVMTRNPKAAAKAAAGAAATVKALCTFT